MPGPQPTPKHILAMRGSPLANTRDELGDMVDDIPTPPDFVRDRAAGFFRAACVMLRGMGVLAKTDVHAVLRYALTLDRWYSAEEELAKTTIHYTSMVGKGGETKMAKPTPALAQANICHDQLRQLEQVLGFTCADRTKLGMATYENRPKKADPMKALLSGG